MKIKNNFEFFSWDDCASVGRNSHYVETDKFLQETECKNCHIY